jgi:hypothetical protein
LGRNGFPSTEGRLVMSVPAKIAMENVNSPERIVRVDADKYHAMRTAILAVLPNVAPGLTLAELKERLLPLLPEPLFPSGAKAGWWLMGVQLDLLAKEVLARGSVKPIRLYRR